MRPTVRQSRRSRAATTLRGAERESQAAVSSKARVKRDPGRAKASRSGRTPQRGQLTRATRVRTTRRVRATSR